MSKVAVHMRIARLDPTNEEVVSRQQAVASLVASWRELDDLDEVIVKANEIAIALAGDGTPGAALGAEVEQAIQKTAPAYLCAERPLDVGICAGLAVLELVAEDADEGGEVRREIFAAVLWSALAYQPNLADVRREALRVEVRDACTKRCADAGESRRARVEVEEFGEDEVEGEGADTLADVKAVASDAVNALKHNASLDREELNFLWWALLNRSRLLKKPLASVEETTRLVACAIEGAELLSALPAEVHRDLVLRTLDADPSLSHKDLLKKLGADRDALNGVFGSVAIVERVPGALPLLHSLKVGTATGDGAKVVRPSSEWASRALLEAGIARLYTLESVES